MELKHTTTYINPKDYTLLIVPYGIETEDVESIIGTYNTFNRTLWN